ncbi:MAG: site-specific integrase [Micrococcales bacterium]|nr:site-specific integrase [Micrococcales bacterium]
MTGELADATRPRRARGEGGVYWDTRRDRWIAEKTVGYDGRGKPIRKRGSGKSPTAALKALSERVRQYEAGLSPGADRYTVSEAVEDWLAHGQTGTAPKTLEENQYLYRLHIAPHLGGRRLKDLRATEVDRWLASLTGNLSTIRLKHLHSALNRSVNRAMARGLVERNVVALCRPPKGRPGRPSKSLTVEQSAAILEHNRGHWMHPYVVVSLTVGMRTDEVRGLTWDHVQVHRNTDGTTGLHIEVWRAARHGGDTKTRTSRRTLAVPDVAARALLDQRGWQARRRAVASGGWADTGLVFTTGRGTPLRADNVRRDFRKVIAGVPGLDPREWTPRELRHSFVSVMSAAEVPLEEISRLVGHASTVVTELVYRHELRPVLQSGAQAIDKVFS